MRQTNVLTTVSRFLKGHDLGNGQHPLLVAVSGGPDSVCLLHALRTLRPGQPLHAAHVDHMLRGEESREDALYVHALCRRLEVPLLNTEIDIRARKRDGRLSLEETARNLRYEFLVEASRGIAAEAIFLGHTAGDQAETVLMNIIRGTGTAGLAGMEPLARGSAGGHVALLARPLLGTSRSEIDRYNRDHGLDPRTDSSNQSLAFTRNRVRHQLLPTLQQFNPRIEEALLRLADRSRELKILLDAEVRKAWPKTVVESGRQALAIRTRDLADLPRVVAAHLLQQAILLVRGDLRGISAVHLQALVELAGKGAGKVLHLPDGPQCWTERGLLRIAWTSLESQPPGRLTMTPLIVPGVTEVGPWQVHARTVDRKEGLLQTPFAVSMECSKAWGPLWVRSRQNGDRFQPAGMSGTKKLQDFLVDAGVPRTQRENIPLVCNEGGILWMVGHRLAQEALPRLESHEVLRVEFIGTLLPAGSTDTSEAPLI